MKKKILFIINPISGVRIIQKKALPFSIEKYLDQRIYDYSISYTQHQGHATALAKEAVENGYDVVVAVGGDGSINEIARSLMSTDAILAIIPFGSGNGLARHLGISVQVRKALKIINRHHTKKIDVAEFSPGRYFFSNVGVGFASYVAERFETHKVRGFLSYAFAVLGEFTRYRTLTVQLKINGQWLSREVVNLNVFNSNQFGYGVGLVPEAKLDDGKLNVSLLNKLPRWRFPFYALCILLKRHDRVPYLENLESASFEVINAEKQEWLLQVDGECQRFDKNWQVKVYPLALNVLVP